MTVRRFLGVSKHIGSQKRLSFNQQAKCFQTKKPLLQYVRVDQLRQPKSFFGHRSGEKPRAIEANGLIKFSKRAIVALFRAINHIPAAKGVSVIETDAHPFGRL